jgi:hypothetical protein
MGHSHARRSRDGLLRCVAFPRVKAAATGVPQWLAGTSTQSGHWHAPNGKDDLVSNRLYIGKIVFNRQRFIKDPLTGRRQARPNPSSEWLEKEVSELAMPLELFDAVQHRRKPLLLGDAYAANPPGQNVTCCHLFAPRHSSGIFFFL